MPLHSSGVEGIGEIHYCNCCVGTRRLGEDARLKSQQSLNAFDSAKMPGKAAHGVEGEAAGHWVASSPSQKYMGHHGAICSP